MIGARIRQAQLAAGWSQDVLAEQLGAAGYPLTKAVISKYENEKSSPPARLILKLARVLNSESRNTS